MTRPAWRMNCTRTPGYNVSNGRLAAAGGSARIASPTSPRVIGRPSTSATTLFAALSSVTTESYSGAVVLKTGLDKSPGTTGDGALLSSVCADAGQEAARPRPNSIKPAPSDKRDSTMTAAPIVALFYERNGRLAASISGGSAGASSCPRVVLAPRCPARVLFWPRVVPPACCLSACCPGPALSCND